MSPGGRGVDTHQDGNWRRAGPGPGPTAGTLMPSYPIDLLRGDDCGSVERKRQAQALSGSASPTRGGENGQAGWTGSSPSPFPSREGVVLALLEASRGERWVLREERKVERLFPAWMDIGMNEVRKENKTQKNQSGKKIEGQIKIVFGQDSRRQVLRWD